MAEAILKEPIIESHSLQGQHTPEVGVATESNEGYANFFSDAKKGTVI